MDEMEKKVELESKLIDEEEVGEVTAGSTVTADVAVYARVEVTFKKGAEPYAVTTKKDGAKADVENHTKGTVELIGKNGSDLIGSGEKGQVSDAFDV